MLNSGLAIASLIDTPLWNDARWNGVVIGVDQTGKNPPFFGLFFENKTAGVKIFDDWVHRFGSEDEFDEIRVSIIEGEVPGKPHGYYVTVSSDLEGILSRAKQDGTDSDAGLVATVTRYTRAPQQPESPFLSGFKAAYAQHHEYLLLGAYGSRTAPAVDFSKSIRKKKILMRHIKDVSRKNFDLDAVVLD